MNTYHTKEEKDQLDFLVDGWTFWNQGTYYAREDRRPDARIHKETVFELSMALNIAKHAGYFR